MKRNLATVFFITLAVSTVVTGTRDDSLLSRFHSARLSKMSALKRF